MRALRGTRGLAPARKECCANCQIPGPAAPRYQRRRTSRDVDECRPANCKLWEWWPRQMYLRFLHGPPVPQVQRPALAVPLLSRDDRQDDENALRFPIRSPSQLDGFRDPELKAPGEYIPARAGRR